MDVEVDDATYHVQITGDGPPVVLLHGFTSSGQTWRNLTDALKDTYTVISIDLPGHGKTVTPDRSMKECCTDLAFLLQSLHYTRVHMVGYSMGGRVALSFAYYYPELVKSLLLESASPGLRTEKERFERKSTDEKLARRIEEDGIFSFVAYWENIPLFESQRSLPEEIRIKVQEERLAQKEKGLAMSLRKMGTGSQMPLWSKLEEIQTPTMLLAGEYDHKFVTINQEMQQKLSSAILRVVPSAGHTVHLEQPKIFSTKVLQFLYEQEQETQLE